VTDAWLANAGDGAIALATHARLTRMAPGASILHAAYQADLVGDAYPQLSFVPPLAALLGVTPTVPEMQGWTAPQAEAVMRDADAVLVQGGGFAMEHYDPRERLLAWDLLVDRGIPLAFSAQSIGPFSAASERAVLARVLGRALVVGVREPLSRDNAIEMGADPARVLLGADEAFSLFPSPPDEAEASARRGIAAVLTRHPVARPDGSVVSDPAPNPWLEALVESLLELAGDEGITLLSTQQGLGHLDRGLEDDAELARGVRASLAPEHRDRVAVADGYLAPMTCAELIARHRALVTMRLHPAILALSRGVPTVAVKPAFKTEGVLGALELGVVVTDGPESTPAAVAERVGRVLAPGAPGPRALWKALAGARRRADVNDAVVARLLAAA
jgi:polysaccharide pyruvyl transferase WcaK-like protein